MKAWTVIGYTQDGEAMCPECMDKRFHKTGGEFVSQLLDFVEKLSPVFASDEHHLECDDCHEALGK